MKNTLLTALVILAFVLSTLAAGVFFLSLQGSSEQAGTREQAPPAAAREVSTRRSSAAPAAAETENSPRSIATRPPPQLASVRLPRAEVPATKEELEAEATFVARQLVELIPDQAISLHVMAMLKAQLHQTAEAEELWARCIDLDPASEPYYVNLAAIQLDRGKSEQAVATLEKSLAAGLASQDISHHLGIALNSSGQPERAAEVAEAALKSNPGAGPLWLILGQAQLQLGQHAEAETSLRQAIDLGVNSKAAYFALFNTCMRLGKREEAAEFRERYSAFKEKELSADERYQVLSEAEARRICISVLSESAAVYLAIPDDQTAEHLLLRVIALDPENLAACEDLAKIYAGRGELANEIAVRERIVELDTYNLMHYLLLAKAFVAADAPANAEAQIKMAISYSPQMVTGYAAMTDFLMEQGQPAKAQWYVEQAIRLKPSAQGFDLLAKTLKAQGKTEAAKAAMDMSAEISTTPARQFSQDGIE